MDNKTIRQQRVRRYFVDAAKTIIEEEGIDGVTLRKVAKGAGYNSATLYNYFRNVDHVISIALHDHMGDYVDTVLATLNGNETPFQLYQIDWTVYAEKSFHLPKEYYYLFYRHPDINLSEVYNEYFRDHPGTFEKLPRAFQEMSQELNQYSRDLAFLRTSFPQVEPSVLHRISEMNILIHKAMLFNLCEAKSPVTPGLSEEYTAKFKQYFSVITREIQQI